MRIDDVISLILESNAPVEIKFTDGRISRALIKAGPKEMETAGIARLLLQISERAQHGTLTAHSQDGTIIVQWEESILIGDRR